MARFDNKVVLVSGGARGRGRAEARLLVAQGAKVVIGDVLDNQGQALAVELGPAASFVRHDVTSEADWARAVETAQKLGGLHGLVNNAGIYQPAALMETDDALWQRHIQINQSSCFLGMKAVVPAMERSGGGPPRQAGREAGDGWLGRRVHREYLVGRRPQRLARVLRLCRD